MPTKTNRPSVLIPENIATAFRARVGSQYPQISASIHDASLSHLIRFIVLVTAGVPVDEAQKGLTPLNGWKVDFNDPPGD